MQFKLFCSWISSLYQNTGVIKSFFTILTFKACTVITGDRNINLRFDNITSIENRACVQKNEYTIQYLKRPKIVFECNLNSVTLGFRLYPRIACTANVRRVVFKRFMLLVIKLFSNLAMFYSQYGVICTWNFWVLLKIYEFEIKVDYRTL